MLAGTDAGTGVRGHVGVWGGILLFSPYGWERSEEGHTGTHTHTHRNVHANVAPTLKALATYPLRSARVFCFYDYFLYKKPCPSSPSPEDAQH